MSAIIAATTVGTAFNIYSGITQGKAAKNAENAQAASLAANQGIASLDLELTNHADTDFDMNLRVLNVFLNWKP